jgi:hypothetical protein
MLIIDLVTLAYLYTSVRLDCRVSWVRIPPTATLLLFFEKKELSWACLPRFAFLPRYQVVDMHRQIIEKRTSF